MKHGPLRFDSLEEEVQFLRGLVAVQRLADEVLEDCLERQLGLTAAADIFLTQCARMIHAQAAFVQLKGTQGPVLTRVWGPGLTDVVSWADARGSVSIDHERTLFVAALDIGKRSLGSLGFVLPGRFSDGEQVMALVETIAEMFDSAVLSFLAIAEGHTPNERLDEMAAAGTFHPHARIGKFELLEPLGTGGMAQVMVARTVNPAGISRLVALKRILPRLAQDDSIVEQFLDEARLGMRLSHPNLVTVYDFGQANGSYFIVMELVAGVDFDHLVSWPHGPLPERLVSAVVTQALEGLHHAHGARGDDGKSLGLVHRDLSPHNLMVGFDGRVKVLDFGVAKMRSARTVTLPGIVKGKPIYMSPEQATAAPLDCRSDLFSIGLILYEALTGQRAFDQHDDTKTMESIVNEPLARPAGLPNHWWGIIETALQKRPENRYQSAFDMAQAIRERVEPMNELELGALVSATFPRRVAQVASWEQTKNRLASQR
jgi:eukaryotic-like serine/threonine-protein kinase